MSQEEKNAIPVQSMAVLDLSKQAQKVAAMKNSYFIFMAVTMVIGAAIAWLAASVVPWVIFMVASQAIYVMAIEDDYADSLSHDYPCTQQTESRSSDMKQPDLKKREIPSLIVGRCSN